MHCIRRLSLFSLLLLLNVLGCATISESVSDPSSPGFVERIESEIGKLIGKEKDPEVVKILFGGDVMFNWGIRDTIKSKGELAPVQGLKGLFEEADLRVLNLETPVISEKSWDLGKAYVFQAKESDLESMSFLGVDYVSLGNNHAMDHGPEGLQETIKFLSNRSIFYAGAGNDLDSAFRPWDWEVKEKIFKFYSATSVAEGRAHYAGTKPGVMPLDLELIKKKLQSEKGRNVPKKRPIRSKKSPPENETASDPFRVFSLHWGVEYSPFPTQEQRRQAKELADQGIKVIIGHHPHIPQGIERIGKSLVFYSLGNLIFGSRNSYLNHNLIVILHIKKGELWKAELVPIFGKFQTEDHLVRPLEGEEAKRFLEEISVLSADLGTKLRIEGDRAWVDLD